MQFKNVSDSPQDLPTLDLRVLPGETFEATGADAKNLTDSPLFERIDKSSKSSTDTEEK